MGCSDKKSRVAKALTTNSLSLGHHQVFCNLRKKSHRPERQPKYQPSRLFITPSGSYDWYMKENQTPSWEPLNIIFIICVQNTVRNYPIKKREQNSMKLFFKTLSGMYFYAYWNATWAATLCLVLLRNSATGKGYSMVWPSRNKRRRAEQKQKRRFSS